MRSDNWFGWATVTDDSPLEVQLDGEDTPLDLGGDTTTLEAGLTIGDRVWVQIHARRVILHGSAK